MFDKTTQNIDQSHDLTTSELIKFFTGADKGKLIHFFGHYDEYGNEAGGLILYEKQIIEIIYSEIDNKTKISYISIINSYGDNVVKGKVKYFYVEESLDEICVKLKG